MQVEIDDADADWARPGVYQVSDRVYRIPLPLPHAGLRAVNAYALVDDSGLVLVDSGWGIESARDALDRALAALDRRVVDVRRFLVTHVHRDHYGLAVALRREFGHPVSLGEGERPAIEALSAPGHRPFKAHARLMVQWGAGPLVDRLRARTGQVDHDPADWAAPDDWLTGGSDVALPGRTLRVVATPGHTRGHVVFVDEGDSLLFAGDHVLPHITPSIGFEVAPTEQPLGDFLQSLRLVRDMPDRRLLPAHGPVRPSVHARVDELLHHHADRLDATQDAVAGDSPTAYEVADRLSWTRRRRRFAELDPFNQMLAVAETAAHLDLLVAQGRLKATETGEVRRYGEA
jgi:glyoxylase-like metal-dependent hydrolase (beta-lactamase superfamily II)